MGSSRFGYRTRLYSKAALAVILAVAFPAFAQYAKHRQVSKGPRALGVLELAANGKAHLIPVTIMIDGKFYDAGAYKADPVPMALQSETVYEAVKSGVSQGLFTVGGAMQEKDSWVADGNWRSNADIQADAARRKAERAKLAQKAPDNADIGGPPKLRRAPGSSDESSSPSAKPTTPPAPEPKPSASSSNSGAASGGESSGFVNTPDRPVLRRTPASERTANQSKAGSEPNQLKGPIQLIPAISDSAGPEPRPYTFETKPDEKQKFLTKMLAMATEDVQGREARLSAETQESTKAAKKRTAPAPQFRDVQLRIFDLTNSNEPVLVLTANASIPNSRLNLQYSTVLVAREDIYGDLHKVFLQTTDNQHLDVQPRYEFIDAVDADGDGRGELLFRTTWDSGPVFCVYAAIGDQLWPLFNGKPGA